MEFMKCGQMPKVCFKVQTDGSVTPAAGFVLWKFNQGDPGPTPSRLKKSHIVMFFRAILYFAALV